MISVELICLVAGFFISGLVQAFKGWDFVQRHTKWVALALSGLVAVVGELTLWSMDWQGIVACTLVPFATAVTTYEVAKDATGTTKTVG